MRFIIFILWFFFSLKAQETTEPFMVHHPKDDNQYGANIRKAELALNQNISKANASFIEYANLFNMKIGSLPHKTIITKGITKGDDCISKKEEQKTSDCIKVEQFDFVEGDRGVAQGPRSKSMILFFSDVNFKEADKKNLPQAKLVKIKSQIYSHNLLSLDKKFIEVIDTDPLGNPDHDDKIFITSQADQYFSSSKRDSEDNITARKYNLQSLENSKSNPLRNQFKREAYLKHLQAFEKILSKVYHYNEVKHDKNK